MALTEKLAILLETVGARGVVRDLDSVGSASQRLGGQTDGATGSLAAFGLGAMKAGTLLKAGAVLGAGVAAKELGEFGISAIQAASSLEEAINRVNVVFGENAQVVHDWAAGASDDFGQSQRAAEAAAGTFGNMFAAMGLGSRQSLMMSQAIVELGSDVASLTDLPIPEVLDRLRSGLLGEQEAVERLGVNMSETRIKAEGLAMGIGNGTRMLTAAEKAVVAYAIIMEDTALAQGDFDRTSGSLANQQRQLTANWEDMQAELGQKLLPMAIEFFQFLNDTGIPAMVGLSEIVGEGFSDAAGFFIGAMADIMSVISQALEKVDQFVPGMEGVPEALKEQVAMARRAEAGLHDFQLELDGTADAAADTSAGVGGLGSILGRFSKTVGGTT
ncbi:MAG: hypothetical protein LC798_19355, partial [Chloroflexi bacterium]|nr:hypothetical protein [Chloroflexota bacterium]